MSNKKGAFFPVLILILFFHSCNHFSTADAVKVNDEVVMHQKKLAAALAAFISTLESKEEITIQKALEELKITTDSGLVAISKIVSPECNEIYLAEAKALFDYHSTACESNYQQIANYYSADSISYAAYDSLEVLVQEFKQEQDKVNQAFLNAQQNFGKDCGFKLIQNEK
jgi:DNA replication protein DnaD